MVDPLGSPRNASIPCGWRMVLVCVNALDVGYGLGD